MIPLYTKKEFDAAKSNYKLPLKCRNCSCTFMLSRYRILHALNKNTRTTGDFCSHSCQVKYNKPAVIVTCKNCSTSFRKQPKEIKKSKNNFCSRSCSGTYNNTHRKHGTRRSKLETWLEEQLTKLYPKLEIHFNRKDTINSELDIYFPSFKLAIELNGIFHYEPIFGEEKLSSIQNNDERKSQACHELGIEFCTIDTSAQKYFKTKSAQKYLGIISNLVDSKI